jgi:hypothetical protein
MRIRSIAVLLGLLLALGVTLAGEADFHNCAVCKPLMAEPNLMQHMKWDTHTIATGMVSITTVHPDYEEAYARAHTAMMAAVAKLEGGAPMDLCPFCQGMTRLMEAGAKIENVEGAGAHVMVVTSQDPAVIQQIHDHVKAVQEAHAKMHPPEPKG